MPREEKRLATKYVRGRVKAGLPERALSLPSGHSCSSDAVGEAGKDSTRPGCRTPPPSASSQKDRPTAQWEKRK